MKEYLSQKGVAFEEYNVAADRAVVGPHAAPRGGDLCEIPAIGILAANHVYHSDQHRSSLLTILVPAARHFGCCAIYGFLEGKDRAQIS